MRDRGYWVLALVFAVVVVIGGLWLSTRGNRSERASGSIVTTPGLGAQPSGLGEPSEATASGGPPGDDLHLFTRSLFADDLAQPTAMAFGPHGSLYVTELVGKVVVLRDKDGDGRADDSHVFAENLESPLGIAVLHTGDVVVSQRGRITRIRDADGDGVADHSDDVVTGLPVGRHQNDAVRLGLDGRLYWGEGSRSDHGEGGIVQLEASILSANVDGSDLKVVAKGLRNPYGLAFDPATGNLYATDNGRDTPDGVPDELNMIKQDGAYGWPDCWGDGQGKNCAGTTAPLLLLPDHGSADGIAVYRGGDFPTVYDGVIFIALYGANSGDESIGRDVVVAVPPKASGGFWQEATFATGFEHPLAVATDAAGHLYVADMGAGSITRFSATAGSR